MHCTIVIAPTRHHQRWIPPKMHRSMKASHQRYSSPKMQGTKDAAYLRFIIPKIHHIKDASRQRYNALRMQCTKESPPQRCIAPEMHPTKDIIYDFWKWWWGWWWWCPLHCTALKMHSDKRRDPMMVMVMMMMKVMMIMPIAQWHSLALVTGCPPRGTCLPPATSPQAILCVFGNRAYRFF